MATMSHTRPIGLFAWFGFPMPLESRLRHIAAAGFDATALWLGEEEPHVRSGNPDSMPAMARDCGLAVDNVHAPFKHCSHLWSDDAALRAAFVSEMSRCIDFCARHRIPIAVMHISHGTSPPPISTAGLDALGALVRRAGDASVILAIENTSRPDYVTRALAEFDDLPALGICYDSSHDFLTARPCDLLATWGHRLVATHFSDNGGVLDNHWLPGDGGIDWRRVQSAFPRSTYHGTILLETVARTPADPAPTRFLADARARAIALRELLAPPQSAVA
jgi:sugar phosphate isomerase/epimerase